MEERILFIVFNGEVKFIKTATMDHREWYISLGGNMDEYDDVIRGYVMEGKLIFFKADLKYDNEVIDFATKMAIPMKKQLNQPDLKVCCGISPGKDGAKWEPILELKESDLDGYVKPAEPIPEVAEDVILQRNATIETTPTLEPIPEMPEQLEIAKKQAEEAAKQAEEQGPPPEPLFEFKNNIQDPEFIKAATKFTIIMLVLAVIAKVILHVTGKIPEGSRGITLLMIVQIGGLIFSIVGYNQKLNKTKYFALAATIASVLFFDIIDIVIGALVFLFTVDATYIRKIMDFMKFAGKKGKEYAGKGKEFAEKKQQELKNKNVKK